MSTQNAPPRPRVQSAARVVAILLAVAQSERGLTTREISERVGIGRQATYHLLHTLLGTGILTRDDRNRYLLGIRTGTLVEAFARQLAPSEHLAPLIRSLTRATGETSYAAGWWNGEIAVLSVMRGNNPVQATELPQGHIGDAHARASGKLLLAYATPAVREAYLEGHQFTKRTPNTIADRAALDRELEIVRSRGYATDLEEFAPGLCCLAVPMDEGYSPFVISLAAPRERYEAHRDRYLAAMRQIATTASSIEATEIYLSPSDNEVES